MRRREILAAATASLAVRTVPAGAAEPAIAATVKVDTRRVVRRIPRSLFGVNIEVIRDANGLWNPAQARLDPTIVALARDLRPGPIRFPGGVWSDAYDWRDGVGPRAARRPRPTHPGAGEMVANQFGTDEALQFADAVDSRLLITVNAANNNPSLAAEWVRYVNVQQGRAGGQPRVPLWQVGNELYMKGDASGGHLAPDAYAARFLAYAAAMKAADPAIRIGAIGLHNSGRYRLNRYDNWNEVLLRRAGAAIDLLTVHNGYAPAVGDDGNLDPADVYSAMWAAPQNLAANLAETWQEVEKFAPSHAGRIRLGVTEWGPLFAINPASPWLDHSKTLGSAIYVAAALRVFCMSPQLELANFFKLNDLLYMGLIGRRNGAWAPTAPYMAFRMVSRDMQPGLLESAVDVPGYASRAMGMIEAVGKVPYLDVLSTLSDDRRTLTVLLINKSLTRPVAAKIGLAGANGASKVTTQTLTGAATDANTGTELPRIPGINWATPRRMGPQGRIDRGAPSEIRLEQGSIAAAAQVETTVPPHSLQLLRFEALRVG